MTVTTTTPVVPGFSAEDVAKILAAAQAQAENEKAARGVLRNAGKALAQDVTLLVTGSSVPRQTFQSGAEGWSIGGSLLGADGNTYKVSILLRDVATIPAKEA